MALTEIDFIYTRVDSLNESEKVLDHFNEGGRYLLSIYLASLFLFHVCPSPVHLCPSTCLFFSSSIHPPPNPNTHTHTHTLCSEDTLTENRGRHIYITAPFLSTSTCSPSALSHNQVPWAPSLPHVDLW